MEFLDHEYFVSWEEAQRDASFKKRARERLEYYRRHAKMIVTSRFHGAAAAIALGIPVILAAENNFYKFSWLSKYLPFYENGTCGEIDWNPEPVQFEREKRLIRQTAVKRLRETFETYAPLCDLSACLENPRRSDEPCLYYIQGAAAYLEQRWNGETEQEYALWGTGNNAEKLYRYISERYPKAVLRKVYDGFKATVFHGIPTEFPNRESLKPGRPVIVTSNTAGRAAEELFSEAGWTEYYLCRLEFFRGTIN